MLQTQTGERQPVGQRFKVPLCQMYSGIDFTDVYRLENVFVYRRNKKIIGQIRENVRNYERAVIEQAKRLEQAKIKEAEAERLKNEAEKLKSNE